MGTLVKEVLSSVSTALLKEPYNSLPAVMVICFSQIPTFAPDTFSDNFLRGELFLITFPLSLSYPVPATLYCCRPHKGRRRHRYVSVIAELIQGGQTSLPALFAKKLNEGL